MLVLMGIFEGSLKITSENKINIWGKKSPQKILRAPWTGKTCFGNRALVNRRKENSAFTKAGSIPAQRQSGNAGSSLFEFIFRRRPPSRTCFLYFLFSALKRQLPKRHPKTVVGINSIPWGPCAPSQCLALKIVSPLSRGNFCPCLTLSEIVP